MAMDASSEIESLHKPFIRKKDRNSAIDGQTSEQEEQEDRIWTICFCRNFDF